MAGSLGREEQLKAMKALWDEKADAAVLSALRVADVVGDNATIKSEDLENAVRVLSEYIRDLAVDLAIERMSTFGS